MQFGCKMTKNYLQYLLVVAYVNQTSDELMVSFNADEFALASDDMQVMFFLAISASTSGKHFVHGKSVVNEFTK